jgi:AraC family transcriptional regulator, transcriptional activator of pobA
VFSAGTDGFVMTLPTGNFPDLFGTGAETATALGRSFIMNTPQLQTRIDVISTLHTSNSPFCTTLLRAEMRLLVSTILTLNPKGLQSRATDPRIHRLEALVRQSLSDNRRIEAFAADLAMSPRHLCRLCKAETGLSAQDFVETRRMHKACRLLAYARMTAKQIAYALGYDDPSYFSRAFKRSLQLSPSEYRAHFDGQGSG